MRTRVIVRGGAIASLALLATAAPAMAQEESGSQDVKIEHAAEECIHLLEKGNPVEACQKAPNPILPATNELVIGGLAFLILLAAMYKFAYPALLKGMAARTQRIRDNLDEAERTKAEAQRILEEYQLQLADAKNESARIIDEARSTAEQMRRDLMVRAEAEVNELRDRTRQEIEAAQHRAVADLRSQVSELAIGAAEVVVQKNLDRDTNRALVERYIEQVGTNA
jgi:F-type H+-transporting ATPase subunit b